MKLKFLFPNEAPNLRLRNVLQELCQEDEEHDGVGDKDEDDAGEESGGASRAQSEFQLTWCGEGPFRGTHWGVLGHLHYYLLLMEVVTGHFSVYSTILSLITFLCFQFTFQMQNTKHNTRLSVGIDSPADWLTRGRFKNTS